MPFSISFDAFEPHEDCHLEDLHLDLCLLACFLQCLFVHEVGVRLEKNEMLNAPKRRSHQAAHYIYCLQK